MMMLSTRADRHLGENAFHALSMNEVRKPRLRSSGKMVGYFFVIGDTGIHFDAKKGFRVGVNSPVEVVKR
jgi:hypothetical protein